MDNSQALQSLSAKLSLASIPNNATVVVPISYQGFLDFSVSIFDYIQMLELPGFTITRDCFIKVSKALLLKRIDFVRSTYFGIPSQRRIPINPKVFSLPTPLAEVLYTIGVVHSKSLGVNFIPEELEGEQSEATSLDISQWSLAMNAIRNYFQMSLLPSQSEGSVAMILVRDTSRQGVVISGPTGEGTPADAFLSAIGMHTLYLQSVTYGFTYGAIDYPDTVRNEYIGHFNRKGAQG